MLQGHIVVLSSRRSASGHFRSLFTDYKPRTFLVTFEYLWEFNSQEITGLIVNLYLNTFLIDCFFVYLTVQFYEIFENRAHGSINSLQNGLAVLSNHLRVYRLGLKIVRLCFLEERPNWINFLFRKASVVCFLSIFIHETWQLRKSCVNKSTCPRKRKEFSHVKRGSNFQVCFLENF